MKSLGRMPWDMMVFLTITTVGFGFSVQKLVRPGNDYDGSARLSGTAERILTSSELSAQTAALGPNEFNQTLDLGCIEKKVTRERITSEEGAVRIKGRLCHLNRKAMKGFEGMHVKNLTNGYEGTIFFHGLDNSFITDFVVLQPGKNMIQVEWRESQHDDAHAYLAEVFEK